MVIIAGKTHRMPVFHVGEWLKREVARTGLTKLAFSKKTGIPISTLKVWFTQVRPSIQDQNLVKLAAAIGRTREEIEIKIVESMRSDPKMRNQWREQVEALSQAGVDFASQLAVWDEVKAGDDPLDQNVDPYSEEAWFEVPMFDLAVAAGRWVDVSELAEVREGAQIDRGYFRIHIRGDSMQPAWPDGSVVEFSVLRNGRHAMEIGADYYVQRDGEATFKRLVKISEDELVFAAVNKRKYPEPFVVARSAIVRMAKAEWMLSKPKR